MVRRWGVQGVEWPCGALVDAVFFHQRRFHCSRALLRAEAWAKLR